MADQQQQQQQQQIPNAPFPAPPPFWKHFTSSNLSRLKALKESNPNPQDIPLELTYLEPPRPPAEAYTVFGEEQTLSTDLPTLASRGVTQLYPNSTPTEPLHHPTYLLLILRSLHLNFGELQTILSQNPSLKDQKLEDIKNLFQNAHWLINMYRPHQARESLIAMMEWMVEDGRREMEKCERMKERVEEVLEGLEKRGRETSGSKYEENAESASTPKEPHQDQYARRLWSMMADIKIEED